MGNMFSFGFHACGDIVKEENMHFLIDGLTHAYQELAEYSSQQTSKKAPVAKASATVDKQPAAAKSGIKAKTPAKQKAKTSKTKVPAKKKAAVKKPAVKTPSVKKTDLLASPNAAVESVSVQPTPAETGQAAKPVSKE
jgi:hypothetical protein